MPEYTVTGIRRSITAALICNVSREGRKQTVVHTFLAGLAPYPMLTLTTRSYVLDIAHDSNVGATEEGNGFPLQKLESTIISSKSPLFVGELFNSLIEPICNGMVMFGMLNMIHLICSCRTSS